MTGSVTSFHASECLPKRQAAQLRFYSIRKGQQFGPATWKERYSVDVNYRGFADDVTIGNTILVDNGLIKLLVLDKGRNRVRCKVLTRAILGSRRHINLPGVHVNLPSLTRKDLADVSLGVEIGADFIGLSFVREKSDIEQLRILLSRKKSKAQIVAKSERPLPLGSIDCRS